MNLDKPHRTGLLGAFVFFDFAVADADDAVGVGGDVGLVSDQDDGVTSPVQAREETHDFLAGLGVQVASGLVGEKDRRMVHQSASDGDALALSAGELVGLVHHAVGQIDLRQSFLRAMNPLFRGRAVIDHGQLDVVERGGAREKIEGLKYETDFAVTDGGKLVVIELADQAAGEPIVSLRG